MKASLLRALAFLSLAASANAEIIGVEQFDYPDGAIAGKNGGTFWDYKNFPTTGHTGTASTWDNVSGAPVVTSGRLITDNSSAKREYNGTLEADGAVNDPASVPSSVAKRVYYRVSFTTGATVPNFITASSIDFGTEIARFGKDTANPALGIFLFAPSPNSTLSGTTLAPNTTYTIVTKLDYTNNIASLYLIADFDFNRAENTVAPICNLSFTATNWSTNIRLASGTGGSVAWDDVVIATTWEDLGTTVTTTADEDNGNLTGPVSLREAVKYSPEGSLINFAPALSGQTGTLGSGEITLAKTLSIDASALPGGFTVDANSASRHFFASGAGTTLTLKALTLANGSDTRLSFAAFGAGLGGSVLMLDGKVFFQRCTLTGISARNGGAVFLQGIGTNRFENCTITGNRATDSVGAGAISLISGNAVISGCTISGNTGSGGGGGLYLQAPSIVTLENTIIAGNNDPSFNDILNNEGTLNATGANLIGSNASVESTFPAGQLAGTQETPLDPKLSPLGHFGGPVQTMHPLIGSPAIDAAGSTDPGGTDARGFLRFMNGDNTGGTQLDIGAVEAGRLITVAIAGDAPNENNLRGVIDAAPLFGPSLGKGTRIGFSPGISPITLTLADLIPDAGNSLFIDASNIPGGVTISGGGNSRVFTIPATTTVAMHSVKITGGKAPDGNSVDFGLAQPGAEGGGILNSGSLSLFSCTVASNTAGNGGSTGFGTGGNGGSGGGISSSGPLTLTACTLSGNAAGNGGSGEFNGLTFAGDGGSGGGIFSSGPLTLTGCTLSGNDSGLLGGGIRNNGSIPYRLTHCTVGDNFASGGGGGISGGNAILQNCLIASNSPDNVNVSSIAYFGANLLDTAATGTATGNLPIISANVLLAPLGDYGGPTQTVALRPGSLARDTGSASTRTKDQRGFPIIGAPDIGAYEAGTITNYGSFIYETLPSTASEAQHSPTFDFDGDGATNGNEFSAGTNVTDASSSLRITSTTRNGANLEVSFTTEPGRNYNLAFNDALTGTWTNTGLPAIAGNGSPATFFIPAPTAGVPKRFYRIELAL